MRRSGIALILTFFIPGQGSSQSSKSLGAHVTTFVQPRPAAGALNACDLNLDGVVNVIDVQMAVNMDLGLMTCTANIEGLDICNTDVVNQVTTAALGGSCVVTSHSVTLNWSASSSSNISGYNVYRSTTSGGPYTKMTLTLVGATNYVDNSVTAGQTYYYVATAVDINNNESAFSNQAQATVPTP